MKMYTHIVLAILGTLAFVPSAPAEQTMQFGEDSSIKMIRLVGEDNGSFYVVYCKNGLKGSVEVYDLTNEVCIGPPRQCRTSWGLLPAAEELCR